MSMSNEQLNKLAENLAQQTGITPEEQTGAAGAQVAAEQTMASATRFAADRMVSVMPARESEPKPYDVTIVSPYNESELSEKEKLLKKFGIEFCQDIYQENKPHLLSALVLASKLGFDAGDIVKTFSEVIKEEQKHGYSQAITYLLASYGIELLIVNRLAEKKEFLCSIN